MTPKTAVNEITPSLSRRSLIQGAGIMAAATTAAVLPGCGASTAKSSTASLGDAPEWMQTLARSATGGRDVRPRVEGRIPTELRGSVYRNGPGLFAVGDRKVGNLLDGDGLVQCLHFGDDGPRYRNKFVQTKKYLAEQAAGRRVQSTWSVRKTDNFLHNLGGGIDGSQAGVTVYPIHGKILARDEIGPSYELDPESLDTLGTVDIGDDLDTDRISFKAHCKFDPVNGDVLYLGTRFGRKMDIHVVVESPDFVKKTQFSFRAPRQVYFHDFFVSENYVIFVLQPCFLNVYPFISGTRTLIDSMTWKGDEASLVGIVPRTGGEVRYVEAPARYIWHALNAYEQSDEIVLDFVSYDEPDHFIGENAILANLMDGKLGIPAKPGLVRRYRIGPNATSVVEDTIDASASREFPIIDPRVAMKPHSTGYFTSTQIDNHLPFYTGVSRIDYASGETQNFYFDSPPAVTGEPVFIPRPGGTIDQGWIVSQCLDTRSLHAFYAIFDAQTVGKGPLAKIWLDHHLPISFHGWWTA